MWIAFVLFNLKWLLNAVIFSCARDILFLIAIQNLMGLIWLESSF